MNGKALLFGLNYAHCETGVLNGCINDVRNLSNFITSVLNIPTVTYTDDTDMENTSYNGIIMNLYSLAVDSYKDNLDFVLIHYSGHGSQKKDTSGDEKDGMDEGLVPSDYKSSGILIDDILNHVVSIMNPRTKVLFICDACHSGTMLDLKYLWTPQGQAYIDNKHCKIVANTILISGRRDHQTSADAYNVLGDNKYVGALSACILTVLKNNPLSMSNVFTFMESVRAELRRRKFEQYPCLTSNYDLSKDTSLFLQRFSPIHPEKQFKPIVQNKIYARPYQYYESGNSCQTPRVVHVQRSQPNQYYQPYQPQYQQQVYQQPQYVQYYQVPLQKEEKLEYV